MMFFEEGLDDYLEQTVLFPHIKIRWEKQTMAMRANPRMLREERNAALKRIYKALGLTTEGKFRKTVTQKRLEKLGIRQRD